MRELSCTACIELSAEVGLGSADAEERAEVLAHVARCAECASALRELTEVGNDLSLLLPPIDPPAGFERRVLQAISATPATPARPVPPLRVRRRPAAVAAVAAAVGLALGGWLAGAATSAPSSTVATAALVSHHRPAGEVVLVSGGHPWISMTVRLPSGGSVVRCEVWGAGTGRLVTLGTFTVSGGYGSWAGPLPGGLAVRGAKLVGAGGQVLATATFPS